jgi:hypothetical protein
MFYDSAVVGGCMHGVTKGAVNPPLGFRRGLAAQRWMV